MKILFITNELSRSNGWSTVAYELNNQWKKEHDITIITNKGSKLSSSKDEEIIDGISVNSYYNPVGLFKDYIFISRMLKDRTFDIVFCNVEPFLPLASLLKKKLSINKFILLGNGTYIYYPFIKFPRKYFNKLFIKSIDLIISISIFTDKKIKEWYKGKTSVVSLGVDTNHYHSMPNEKKEKAFIYVGAQKERKGVAYLINAFKKLVTDHPDAKLYIVGSKNPHYVSMVKNEGLQNNIVFTGKTSHNKLLKYFSRSMCHVLPSVNTDNAFEGFGLVHIEANACGIPSIGSRYTANDEVIVDGKTGFLCKQKDVNDIYLKMKLIIEDTKLYYRLCSNSLPYARKHTWKKTAENMMREIKNIKKLI